MFFSRVFSQGVLRRKVLLFRKLFVHKGNGVQKGLAFRKVAVTTCSVRKVLLSDFSKQQQQHYLSERQHFCDGNTFLNSNPFANCRFWTMTVFWTTFFSENDTFAELQHFSDPSPLSCFRKATPLLFWKRRFDEQHYFSEHSLSSNPFRNGNTCWRATFLSIRQVPLSWVLLIRKLLLRVRKGLLSENRCYCCS